MREWLAAGVIVLVGAQVSAQSQRLGDIADGIRLQTEGDVVIDERVVASPAGRGTTGGIDRARTELTACRDLGRQLLSTVRRSLVRDLFYDPDWREEVRSGSLELVGRVDRLDTVRVPRTATALWLEAITEAETYVELTDRMEGLLATDTPDYRPVLDGLERTNASLDTYLGRLAGVERWMDRAASSAPPTGAQVDEIVAVRCSIHAPGSTDFTLCADRQRRAASILAARTKYSVEVEEATFNAVRNRCAELHPADLADRERCERVQLASVGASAAP